MRAGRIAALALAAALAGCTALDPYPTYPRQPAAGTADPGPRVAICYDALASSVAEVQKAAQDECAPNTHAKRVDTDLLLQYCPLLLPARATFVCAPQSNKQPESNKQPGDK
jgi:hypothetical protein